MFDSTSTSTFGATSTTATTIHGSQIIAVVGRGMHCCCLGRHDDHRSIRVR